MKLTIRFGGYNTHPKDAEPREIELPDGTLLYTPGEHYINHGLHIGALHYLAITKASDEELFKVRKPCGVDVLMEDNTDLKRIPFRMNGYAFVRLSDCLIDSSFSLIHEEELNHLIKQEHLYYIYLSENYDIIKVVRINYVKANECVHCSVVRFRDDFNNSNYYAINPDVVYSFDTIVTPLHTLIRRLDNEYGKKLFDDMCSQVLNMVDKSYEIKYNYDIEWLNKNFSITYPELTDMTKDPVERFLGYAMKVPNKEVEDIYNDILCFRKELPIRK